MNNTTTHTNATETTMKKLAWRRTRTDDTYETVTFTHCGTYCCAKCDDGVDTWYEVLKFDASCEDEEECPTRRFDVDDYDGIDSSAILAGAKECAEDDYNGRN